MNVNLFNWKDIRVVLIVSPLIVWPQSSFQLEKNIFFENDSIDIKIMFDD